MLTYNSRAFSKETWPRFLAFVKDLHKRLACCGWAACLENGTTPETRDKFHVHAYFYWNDGHGIDVRTTDMFVFDGVRPRVDARSSGSSPWDLKLAAYHGLWYSGTGGLPDG